MPTSDVPASQVGKLTGKLEHHTCQCLSRFLETQNRYSTWAALDARDRGKRANFGSLATRPVFKFLQFYLLRGGIFDRTPGLLWCGIVAYYNFMKYAKLWELTRSRTKSAQQQPPSPGEGSNDKADDEQGNPDLLPIHAA